MMIKSVFASKCGDLLCVFTKSKLEDKCVINPCFNFTQQDGNVHTGWQPALNKGPMMGSVTLHWS